MTATELLKATLLIKAAKISHYDKHFRYSPIDECDDPECKKAVRAYKKATR